MGDKRNYAALDWVIGEIRETLNDARQSLESYVEDPRDTARIRFCLTHIHQVHGSLQMVEFHGASLFAEEMESLAEAVMHGQVVNEKEAQEALMRSLLQLPLYLDQVKTLHDDHPGAILPLLNDLRAVRKQSYLSETNLFTPDLSSLQTIRGQRHSVLTDTVKLQQVFKKLREMYQYAAASVLRGIKVEENLAYIEKVLTRLEGVVRGTLCHPIWHVSVGLVEALIREDVELSIAVRGLLRQLAQEIKKLEDQCPEALDLPVKESLLRNMLYYVARAESSGGQWVAQVKERYSLDAALLLGGKAAGIQMGKGMISPPEPEAIRAVVSALQDELNTVKHLLDRALSPAGGIADIEEMLPIVKRIADTLAVMGIGDMRKEVASQHEALAILCESGEYADSELIELAGGLAKIENRLEAISKGAGKTVDLASVDEREIEVDSAKEAVVKECRAGIESVKDAIVDYMSSKWSPEHLSEAVETLHKIQGGLAMIPQPRAAKIVSLCGQYVQKELMQNEAIPGEALQALAETIASVDYFLERIADGHEEDLETYLDLAEEGLVALGYSDEDYSQKGFVPSDEPVSEPLPTPEPMLEDQEPAEESTSIPEVELPLQQEDITPQESIETLEQEMISPVEAEAVVEEDDSDIDDEIIEIFVEEAGEVLETLSECLPQWQGDFSDRESLGTIRRSFHTLKGSGRMVEAMEIGELAWSIENMLNRLIEDTISAHPSHVIIMERVLAFVPSMVDAFENKKPNPDRAKYQQYIDWANEMAQDVIPANFDTYGVSQAEIVEDAPSEELVDEEEDDYVLWDIFASEAQTHLLAVDEFIEQMEVAAPLFDWPSDGLQRALHTLKGSAHMAAITPIAVMITPLETFVKELRGFQVKIDNDILQLFKDAASYTREGLDCIYNKKDVVIAKQTQFIARVNELSDKHVAPLAYLKEKEGDESSANPQMLYTFMAEEMDVLMEADTILASWAAEPEGSRLALVESQCPAFVAELNTCSEGASQANLPEMIALSDDLSGLYSILAPVTLRVTGEFEGVLKAAHYCLIDMMDQIAAGQNVSAPSSELQAELLSFKDLLSAADDSEALPVAEAEVATEEEQKPKAVNKPEITLPEASLDSVMDGVEQIEDEDFDPDILEIFLEEADELSEELDEAVHAWESSWDNPDAVETMTRALHTFKGGARLCSLKALGELTHEYESYLLAKGGPESCPDFFAMLHKYQDLVLNCVKTVRDNFDGKNAPVLSTDVVLPTSANEPEAEQSDDETPVLNEVVDEIDEVDSGEETEGVASVESPESEVEAVNQSDNLIAALEEAKSADVIAFKPKDPGVPVVSEDGGFVVSKQAKQPDATPPPKRQGQDMIKVSSELLEELVNLAGETSISRGRLDQQVSDLAVAVEDIDGTLRRLNEQLRRLDMETEAQVLFRQEQMEEHEQFDSLEMDRYSHLQQLTRSLMESASDLMDLKSTLLDKIKGTETLLLQQSRINSALQEGLMRSRMVPFSRLVPRLRRIVRQVSGELGKNVSFDLDNVEGEMDRSVLERMIAPLEHMLRNAVDHGIEMPDSRTQSGKPESGRILLSLSREGGDILIRLADDGQGVNIQRVRQKAIDSGLISEDEEISDRDVMQFILEAGFSTAESVTQISGRGVGMDVVAGEIKQLGGSIAIDSKEGVGTQFTVRLPFTVSVNRALMVQLGQETFAIPLNTIEGIVRVSPFELEHYYSNPSARFEYAGEQYKVRHLGSILNNRLKPRLEGQMLPLPVILVRSAQNTMALQVDALQGSREIVVKSLGAQFAGVSCLSGATVTGDGSVVVILDPHAIVRSQMMGGDELVLAETKEIVDDNRAKLIMVVDDSVTVRKVTTRFLERQGYDVITAKDGIDALQVLETETPDLMLLDIEMPRMDGFEVAKNMRSTKRCKEIPIIMITSRTGDKHRQHAFSIGVNEYVGKPFQEDALIKIMDNLLGQKSESA